MRSGSINVERGGFEGAGIGGNYWTSLASSKIWYGGLIPSAYRFSFNDTKVAPVPGADVRQIAYSLRCQNAFKS